MELAATAPWWGVPVVAGSFLIVGALLGFWFNRLQDERKAKRDRAYQWDQKLLERASGAITLLRRLNGAAHDHDAWMRTLSELAIDQMKRGDPVDPIPVEKPTLEALLDTFAAFNEEFTTIQLLAPETVRHASVETYHYATFLMEARDTKEIQKAARDLSTSSAAFEKAVRLHFGIS